MRQRHGVELDRSIGYALKQAAVALRSAMEAELRPLGLSVPQYACLEVLAQRPGVSTAEAARMVFVTRQSMHSVLLGLQERGLLARPPVAPSGRALPTELTAAGRSLLARATARVAAVERRMTQAIPAERHHELREDLAACVRALSG